MDQIREGAIFSLPDAVHPRGLGQRLGQRLLGHPLRRPQGRLLELAGDPVPEPRSSRSGSRSVTGYALALWNVNWANTFLFILFICAFVPFQIIMIPLIILSTGVLKVYGTIWGIAIVHAVLAMPFLTLIFRNYYKDIPQEIMSAAMMDSGSLLADLLGDHPADERQHHDRGADPPDHLDLERLPARPDLRRPRHAADDA